MKVTLYQQDVVFARAVRASGQEHAGRTRLFARVEHEGVAGFGEVAPQPDPLNGDPGLEEVLEAVALATARLSDVVAREGAVPAWPRIARLHNAAPASNVAYALLEMAVLDRELRASGRSVHELWPVRYVTPRQGTVSLLDDATPWPDTAGLARLRVKTAPGPLSERGLDRLAHCRVPVLLDFNCSARSDEDVVAQLATLGDVASIAAVEQPYGVGNLVGHARLAEKLDVPLGLDESVRARGDLARIAHYHAASMVCVKPARVGGLANAWSMVERARELNLAVYLGGFFESAFARRVHHHFANACVSEASDLDLVALSNDEAPEVHDVPLGFGLEPARYVLANAERSTL